MKNEEVIINRNYGIDLLRIFSMLMVPLLHVVGHGGIINATDDLTVKNIVVSYLQIASLCAVNSYALISGYVGYGRKQKYSKLILLTFQVVFYTFITSGVFLIFKPELVDRGTILSAIFPFAYNTYWYYSAYFCLFFFIPFINAFVENLDRKKLRNFVIFCFLILSILPTIFRSEFGNVNRGYSFLWLAVLYVFGAYIKKYEIRFSNHNVYHFLGYVLCTLLTLLSKIGVEFSTSLILGETKHIDYLIRYTSPTIILCSVFLLMFFSNIKCNKYLIKFINWFAPVSFGVYLFHEEPLIRDTFIKGAFAEYASFNIFLLVLLIIVTTIIIWFIGSIVDMIRLKIFDILRIKHLCVVIEEKIEKFLDTIKVKFANNSI